MIADVLTWWTRQMIELVPSRFLGADPSGAGALLIETDPAGRPWRLLRRGADGEQVRAVLTPGEAAHAPEVLGGALDDLLGEAEGRTVLLRLPQGGLLQREVTVPLAAEGALERVLGYEMDRLTPFAAADVFFTWSVLRRDREAGRLRLLLSVVPKAPLAPLLAWLAERGAGPQAIEAGGLRIPLSQARSTAERRERRLLGLAGGACAVLALLAVLLPFALQSVAASRLAGRMGALAPSVATAQALRGRIAGSSAGSQLLDGERRRLGDTLAVLAAVTDVVPDNSYLTDLTLRDGQLTISGQSPGAAALLTAMSGRAAFSTPAFAAPVTRIEGQNTDLFSIRAGVADSRSAR